METAPRLHQTRMRIAAQAPSSPNWATIASLQTWNPGKMRSTTKEAAAVSRAASAKRNSVRSDPAMGTGQSYPAGDDLANRTSRCGGLSATPSLHPSMWTGTFATTTFGSKRSSRLM